MKTKAMVATLLVAAAASADARFAWPYPPKAVSPDEIGHWVVINGNAWSHDVRSELTTASPCRRGDRTGRSKIIANQKRKRQRSRLECFILRGRHQSIVHRIPTLFVVNETEATDSKLLPAASLG